MNPKPFLLKPLATLSLSALFLVGNITLTGCSGKDNPAATQAKAQEYIERAESYRRQGQYRAAIIETRNALQQNPQDRKALLKMATILNELGQGKPALKLLEPFANEATRDEALAIAKSYFLQHKYQSTLDYLAAHSQKLNLASDAEANLLITRTQLKLGQIDAAEASLAKLNPEDVQVSLERLHLAQLRGDVKASQSELNQLLQQHPDNVDVLSEAAQMAERQGNLSLAEDYLSKALINLPTTDVLVPQKAEVLRRLVNTLTKLGRSNEALVYAKSLSDANPEGAALQDKFKQGLELFQAGKPDEAEPILVEVYTETQDETVGALLGMIRYAKNDLQGAAKYLTNAIDPETSPESAMATLAATQLQLAQPEKLLAMFDAPTRARIKNPELKLLIGIALLQTGSTREGEALIQAAQTEQPDNLAMRATLAKYYLSSRQPEKAIGVLEPATKTHQDENLTQLLISAYLFDNKPDQALATAKRLVESTAGKAESWWAMGRTALLVRKLDIAESSLQNAIKKQPDFSPAQLDLAQLHLLRKEPEKAEALYRDVLKAHPDNIMALRGMVATYAQRTSGDKGFEEQLLAAVNTDDARAAIAEYYLSQQKIEPAEHVLQGIAADSNSRFVAAVKRRFAVVATALALQAQDFDTARTRALDSLKREPNNPDLMLMLARVEIGAGKVAEAKKIEVQLNQLIPQSPALLDLQGDLAALDKQYAQAAALYQKAWDKTHNDGVATKLYQSLQNTDTAAAAKLIEKWRQANPRSDMPFFFDGVQQQFKGAVPAAITAYEAAIERNPRNAYALNNLAVLYQQTNDSRALKTAEAAYNLNPKDPAIIDTLGWLLVQHQQAEKGIKLLRDAAAIAPDVKEIQQHLQEAQAKAKPTKNP